MSVDNIGRPLKFETPEELQKKIDLYFEKTPAKEWTVTGVAMVVGSKQLLQDYEKRDGYRAVVIAAKLKVENSYEIDLRSKGRSGDIFALKNFGWKDKTEQEINAKISLTPQARKQMLDELRRR